VAIGRELIEDFIGADRLVAVPHQFEHPATLGGEPQALAPAESRGPLHRPGYASGGFGVPCPKAGGGGRVLRVIIRVPIQVGANVAGMWNP
jgi:hypothetical protein